MNYLKLDDVATGAASIKEASFIRDKENTTIPVKFGVTSL